ncbi:hypothetical protein PTTG_10557, partial [Puccinia triticina 1-1 BBBD Race 1]
SEKFFPPPPSPWAAYASHPPPPPDPIRLSGAPPADHSDMMEDLEVRLPPRPTNKPPASSLHILLTKTFGVRDENSSVTLEARLMDLVLELSENNKRLVQRLESTVDQLKAKVDAK